MTSRWCVASRGCADSTCTADAAAALLLLRRQCCCRLHYIIGISNATYLHLKWPVVHQQLHGIRNTAHRPSTQASYTASRVRPKRKISCAAAQIAATLTISFLWWRHMSLTSYWGQQRMSSKSYPGQLNYRRCHSVAVLTSPLHQVIRFSSAPEHRCLHLLMLPLLPPTT